MKLGQLVEAFLAHLERRGCRPSTLKGRRWTLKRFLSWAGDVSLNPRLLEGYKLFLLSQTGLCVRTVHDRFGAVLGLVRWAAREEHLLWAGLDFREKAPSHQLRFIPTVEEMERLLEAPPATPLGYRDRAILETLYGTGLRNSELRALNLQDLDFSNHGLWVRQGKGAKDRLAPLGDHLRAVLERYLQEVRPHFRGGQAALFLTRRGGRLSDVTLSLIVRNYSRTLGLTRLCTHSIRHAYATHLLEGGASLVELKQLLGHSRIDATQVYTRVVLDELVRQYQRTHPRARRAP